MAIVSGNSITKLLAKRKTKNVIHDQQNDKESGHKKSDFFLGRTTGYSLVRILAIIVGVVGLTVVIGWVFNNAVLESLVPNSVTMKFSTALSFLMSCFLLYLMNESKYKNSELSRMLLPAPIMIVLFFMMTLLVSAFIGINTGVENMFIREKAGAQGSVLPGVPSVATMINFLLITSVSALSLIQHEKRGKETGIIGGIVCAVSATALLGYVANIPLLYYLIKGFSTAMAIHTAMTFLLIGIALMIHSKTKHYQSLRENKILPIQIKIPVMFCGSIAPIAVLMYLFHTYVGENLTSTLPEVVTLLSFALVASIFIAKFILIPINQLTKMVKEISRGKLGMVINPKGIPELVNLTMSINRMLREIKDQNDDLKRAKEQFHALYDRSPDLYRTIDSRGIIIQCNKSYAEHLGYSMEEIIGKSIFTHTSEKDLEAIKNSFETWKKNGIVSNREIWLKRKDGTTFPTLLSANALYDEGGKIIGSNTVIRNLSEIYEAKNEALEQKQKRLLAIGEVSARISHDLRNPLSVIKTSVALLRLRTGSADEKTQSDLVRIERAISRMTHQIDEVLDYVTPKPLNIQPTSILKILSSAMERLLVPETIAINFPREDINIACDPEKLEVVLINLITNAIQAMRNAGSIHVRARSENDKIIIELEDTGPGINDYVLPRLFDPLFTTKQTGTGLGLVSCKRIVEKHGGTIEAKNGPMRGALFIITLPKTTR